ncbi:MAG TPA: methionyl-tRNA formyltransferase [Acidimicrobiia bacterium]|nr:methionyl-tRNA formyltransferase [Acidimicrobiia bacterium]
MTRAVFLGSPAEAVPSLRRLTEAAEVTMAITNPDRARGRSGRPQPTPVKEAAGELGIPVEQPASHLELLSALVSSRADVGVVVAYGRIIRPESLAVPRHGLVNVHFSLLPRWRGASPVVRAILAGDEETGVCLMHLDEGMDTGPVIAERRTPIGESETAGELTERLAVMGGDLLAETLADFVAGAIEPVPQPDEGATAAAKVQTAEAFVSPLHGADAVLRAVRAFHPKPGAWTTVEGRRFKIWSARPASADAAAGTIVESEGRVLLGLRRGAAELVEVQPEGKGRMAATEWMRGRRAEPAAWGAEA